VGPDPIAVGFQTDLGNGLGAGADRQHDRLGLDRARPAGLEGDDDFRRSLPFFKLGRALDDLDLVLLHQEADAGVQLFGHAARAGDDGVEVEADLVSRQAVVLEVAQALIFLAGLEQGLGRDAAPVQADAAQVLALDDGDLLAQLAGADGGDIAAGAGADDDEVEFSSHNQTPSPSGLSREPMAAESLRRRKVAPAGPVQEGRALLVQASIVTGSSISGLKACRKRAPMAPSTTR